MLLPLLLLAQTFPLTTPAGLKPHQVKISPVTHRNQPAIQLVEHAAKNEEFLAIVEGASFTNGTIEVELAGLPGAAASATARGFVGIAFHLDPESLHYNAFYLRPTNGRAEDQVRRNHSAQYIAHPDFPWFRLRKEFPEMYESYVDLEPGVWTRVRIEVDGGKARLYVHGSGQPTLIVNELKHRPAGTAGRIALWIGPGTEGYFRNLRVTPRP